jgi:general secretion pathway protein I
MMRGFTLIEVLIALAILAVALAAAGRATGSATDGARILKQRTLGAWVAQNRLNEEMIKRSFPAVGVQSGDATQAGQTFTWRETISQTENPKFRKVEIKVSAKGDEAYAVASLIGYLTDPTP